MEGLEALKEIKSNPFSWEKLKDSLDIIEKELKALEIIKKNIKIKVDFSISVNRNSYFMETQEDIIPISKEEYDLLKEVLKWNTD